MKPDDVIGLLFLFTVNAVAFFVLMLSVISFVLLLYNIAKLNKTQAESIKRFTVVSKDSIKEK